jgi:hypothetical protein
VHGRKKGGPPNSINYFKQAWADARALAEQEIEVPTPTEIQNQRRPP